MRGSTMEASFTTRCRPPTRSDWRIRLLVCCRRAPFVCREPLRLRAALSNLWHWWWDFSARWLQPSLGFVALVSGTLISFDFADLRSRYPRWAGLFDVLDSGFFFWAFIISALSAFAIGLGLSRREKTMAELRASVRKQRSEVDEIGNNIINVFDGLLLNLGRKLGLQQGDQVRISLYVHDPEHRRFIPCGRYSPNPTLGGPGRTSYPDDQGCIFEGWKKGWHFDNTVPSSGVPRRTYNKNNYNIPDAVNATLRMASSLYAVKRLDNALGQAVAVLVVEATESNHFSSEQLQASLEGVADDFSRMVHTLRGYIPNPSKAAESGL